MSKRLGPIGMSTLSYAKHGYQTTHKILVVKSFMSQTTKLEPPLAHPTEPRCAASPLGRPAG